MKSKSQNLRDVLPINQFVKDQFLTYPDSLEIYITGGTFFKFRVKLPISVLNVLFFILFVLVP